MRIDKYLKQSRIIKRRTVAKEVCEAGKVSLNGKVVKPGDIVKVGDAGCITFGEKSLRFRVTDVSERAKPDEMYVRDEGGND